jgi:hypothetical protein
MENHLQVKGDEVDAVAKTSQGHENLPRQKVIDQPSITFDTGKDDPRYGDAPR